MRILHLTFDMRIGGAERVIKTLVENMGEPDYEISVLCLERKIGPFGQQLTDAGYRVDAISRNPGFDVSLIFKLRQYLTERQIDLLHCHQYTPWAYGALAASMTRTRVIFTEHGRFYPDRSFWKRRIVNPVLLHFTDCVTAISRATQIALDQFEFVPKPRIRVVYNGIQPVHADRTQCQKLRNRLGIPDQARVVGTVARLDPIKNHAMMLRAFKQTLRGRDDIRLLIVGDGPEMQNLTRLSRELNLEDYVIFTGFIDKPENHLDLMDIFLLSSLSEGAAMTLLEAMSLGKPCIVTEAGGNAELILDRYNGIVVESDNTNEFAGAMTALLSEPGLADSMSKNALERYKEMYSSRIMCEAYSSLYDLVCP